MMMPDFAFVLILLANPMPRLFLALSRLSLTITMRAGAFDATTDDTLALEILLWISIVWSRGLIPSPSKTNASKSKEEKEGQAGRVVVVRRRWSDRDIGKYHPRGGVAACVLCCATPENVA